MNNDYLPILICWLMLLGGVTYIFASMVTL